MEQDADPEKRYTKKNIPLQTEMTNGSEFKVAMVFLLEWQYVFTHLRNSKFIYKDPPPPPPSPPTWPLYFGLALYKKIIVILIIPLREWTIWNTILIFKEWRLLINTECYIPKIASYKSWYSNFDLVLDGKFLWFCFQNRERTKCVSRAENLYIL